MIVPREIRPIIAQRGHLRNLEKLMARDYPKALARLSFKYPGRKFAEQVFLDLKVGDIGRCQCGEETRFLNFKAGYKPHCSLACAAADEDVKNRRVKTNLERFGVVAPVLNQRVLRKTQKTMKARHGVDWGKAMTSETLREKARQMCMQRYGVWNFSQSDEYQLIMTKEKTADVQARRESTMMDRYGVRSPLQIPEVFERQAETNKSLKVVNIKGKCFKVRGYEPEVLSDLIKRGFHPEELCTTSREGRPSIRWVDVDGTARRYYPDIWVPKDNVIVEVKGPYTLGLLEGGDGIYEEFHRKMKATAKAGYTVVLAFVSKTRKKPVYVMSPNRIGLSELRRRLRL